MVVASDLCDENWALAKGIKVLQRVSAVGLESPKLEIFAEGGIGDLLSLHWEWIHSRSKISQKGSETFLVNSSPVKTNENLFFVRQFQKGELAEVCFTRDIAGGRRGGVGWGRALFDKQVEGIFSPLKVNPDYRFVQRSVSLHSCYNLGCTFVFIWVRAVFNGRKITPLVV